MTSLRTEMKFLNANSTKLSAYGHWFVIRRIYIAVVQLQRACFETKPWAFTTSVVWKKAAVSPRLSLPSVRSLAGLWGYISSYKPGGVKQSRAYLLRVEAYKFFRHPISVVQTSVS